MRHKQLKKLVNQIVELELAHQNPESSKEEKARIENEIFSLTNMMLSQPNGLDLMFQVDELVQEKLERKVD